jgi:hypothetical protein
VHHFWMQVHWFESWVRSFAFFERVEVQDPPCVDLKP